MIDCSAATTQHGPGFLIGTLFCFAVIGIASCGFVRTLGVVCPATDSGRLTEYVHRALAPHAALFALSPSVRLEGYVANVRD